MANTCWSWMFDGSGNTSHDTRDVTTNNEGHGGVATLYLVSVVIPGLTVTRAVSRLNMWDMWSSGQSQSQPSVASLSVSPQCQPSVSALTAATQTRGSGTGGRGQTQDKVGFYLRNIPDTNPSFWQLLWSDTRSIIIIVSIFAACLSL